MCLTLSPQDDVSSSTTFVLPSNFGGGNGRRVTLIPTNCRDVDGILDACKVSDHAVLLFGEDEMPPESGQGGGDLILTLLRAQGLPSLYVASQVNSFDLCR